MVAGGRSGLTYRGEPSICANYYSFWKPYVSAWSRELAAHRFAFNSILFEGRLRQSSPEMYPTEAISRLTKYLQQNLRESWIPTEFEAGDVIAGPHAVLCII
ncbi:MAG: hypothetical protein ACTHJQ_22135 [Rhizobiaceae bacterium]